MGRRRTALASIGALVATLLALAPLAPQPAGAAAPATPVDAHGYGARLVTSGGAVRVFGRATGHGNAAGATRAPVVATVATPTGEGYWILTRDRRVYAYGDASYRGSPARATTSAAVGIAPTPSGKGYWIVTANGAVFGYGDATFSGSAYGKIRSAVAGIAARSFGKGYWVVARDGAVYAFGDARHHGSGGRGIDSPVSGIAPTPGGNGYLLATRSGSVYAFGDGRYHGGAGTATDRAVIGIAPTPFGRGYWLLDSGGTAFPFGDAPPRRLRASGAVAIGSQQAGNLDVPLPTTKVVPAAAVVEVGAGSVRLDLDGTGVPTPRPGDVVVAGRGAQTPDGLLRKVTAAAGTRSNLRLTTGAARLPHAVPHGRLAMSRTAAITDPEFAAPFQCAGADAPSVLSGSADLDVPLRLDAAWGPGETTADYSARFTGEVVLHVDVPPGRTPVGCDLPADVTGEEASWRGTASVGPVPVALTTEVDLALRFAGHAYAEHESTVSASANVVAGGRFTAGKGTADRTGGSATFDATGVVFEGPAALTPRLEATVTTSVAGTTGPESTLALTEDSVAASADDPWHAIDAGVGATSDLHARTWLARGDVPTGGDDPVDAAVVGAAAEPFPGGRITTTDLPDAVLGDPYEAFVEAPGFGVWAVGHGELPAGLSPGAGGSIAGVPTDAGSFTFTALVFGTDGYVDARDLTIDVVEPPLRGRTERVSVTSEGEESHGDVWDPEISSDGRYVAFTSDAPDLVPGDTNGVADVFVRDRVTGTTERVSVASDGSQAAEWSGKPSISRNGRYVTFTSGASNFAGAGPDPDVDVEDVFLHDRSTGTTELISVLPDAGSWSYSASALSDDGRYVAFVAYTDEWRAFVRDRTGGTTEEIAAEAWWDDLEISADGRYVAFLSWATPGGQLAPFVHDRQAGTDAAVPIPTGSEAYRLSLSADGREVAFGVDRPELARSEAYVHDLDTAVAEPIEAAGTTDSGSPEISDDGRYVTFLSDTAILVRDRLTGHDEIVSRGEDDAALPPTWWFGISGNGRVVVFASDHVYARDRGLGRTQSQEIASDAAEPALSADGRFVAYAVELGGAFVHDAWAGTTEAVSVGAGGAPVAARSPAISRDGRYVTFTSDSPDLVPGDTNGSWDVFLHDRRTGDTDRVSVRSDETEAASAESVSAVSDDGTVVAFFTEEALVADDTNGVWDAYVRDRATGTTERVSVGDDESQGDAGAFFMDVALSADGSRVVLSSAATNLVAGDTNGVEDVFIRDRAAGTTRRLSYALGGGETDQTSRWVSITGDGTQVAYATAAAAAPGDANGVGDVVVVDVATGEHELISVALGGGTGNEESWDPSISDDGRYVAFASGADDLVGAPMMTLCQYVRDRAAQTTERACVGPDGRPVETRWLGKLSADGHSFAFTDADDGLILRDLDHAGA